MPNRSDSGKLWGGRFSSDLADVTLQLSESTEADSRMVFEDIWGSQAHCIMLAHCGIICEDDMREILRWLEKAKGDLESGELQLDPELEDVHMNVEAYVRDGAGTEMGGRLHTARSRNDQVATDGKLHCRRRILDVQDALLQLRERLLSRAEGLEEAVMPGYTHTQHAQPMSVAFWLTGHASTLARDYQRLTEAWERVNTCPLGAAAFAGTSFPISRELTGDLLGFNGVQGHAADCVGTRDWAAETAAALAITMADLSKIAEEFVLWSTYEYRMLELDDAHSTGSSIMPQKKNPCIAELTRGKTGAVYGRLMQLLTILKALPGGYNRDLQEDKPPLWEALDCTELCLNAVADMVKGVTFNFERMRELVDKNFATATEVANYLVRERDMAFRDCHEIVGGLVSDLIDGGNTLQDIGAVRGLLQKRGIELPEQEIERIVDPVECLRRQTSTGSTGPEAVRNMTEELNEDLKKSRAETESRKNSIDDAHARTMQIVEHVLAGGDLADVLP